MCYVFVSNFVCFGLGNRKKSIVDYILSYKVMVNRPSSYFHIQPWAFGVMTHHKQLYFSGGKEKKKWEGNFIPCLHLQKQCTVPFAPACFAGWDTWRAVCNALNFPENWSWTSFHDLPWIWTSFIPLSAFMMKLGEFWLGVGQKSCAFSAVWQLSLMSPV